MYLYGCCFLSTVLCFKYESPFPSIDSLSLFRFNITKVHFCLLLSYSFFKNSKFNFARKVQNCEKIIGYVYVFAFLICCLCR